MFHSSKFIRNLSSSQINSILRSLNFSSCFQPLQASLFLSKKHFCSSTEKKNNEIPSTFSDYELFSDESDLEILDVEEERRKRSHYQVQANDFQESEDKKYSTEVSDLDCLLDLARNQRAEAIVVVKIPEYYNYADFMVIMNAKSGVHMKALTLSIKKMYKKTIRPDVRGLVREGSNLNSWVALDLGNIITHIFLKEARKMYDIDSLWSVGKDYDNLSVKNDSTTNSISENYLKILESLSPKTL